MSEEMNYSANPGKKLVRTVDGVDYLRIPVKTHLSPRMTTWWTW